jgi:hypothetical protein
MTSAATDRMPTSSSRSQTMNRNRPPCFNIRTVSRKGSSLIGEEHHSKLANDTVEFAFAKGQWQCIGLLPVHAVHPCMRSRAVEHRRVEIGGRDVHCRRERLHKGAGNDTRPRRDFQHVSDRHTPQPFGKNPRIRREKHWNQEAVIKLRLRPDEKPHGFRHCFSFSSPRRRDVWPSSNGGCFANRTLRPPLARHRCRSRILHRARRLCGRRRAEAG